MQGSWSLYVIQIDTQIIDKPQIKWESPLNKLLVVPTSQMVKVYFLGMYILV